jgi:hypothetical protein
LTSFFPEFPVVFNAARVPKAVIVNNHHKHTADETPFYFTVSSIDIKTLIIHFLSPPPVLFEREVSAFTSSLVGGVGHLNHKVGHISSVSEL